MKPCEASNLVNIRPPRWVRCESPGVIFVGRTTATLAADRLRRMGISSPRELHLCGRHGQRLLGIVA